MTILCLPGWWGGYWCLCSLGHSSHRTGVDSRCGREQCMDWCRQSACRLSRQTSYHSRVEGWGCTCHRLVEFQISNFQIPVFKFQFSNFKFQFSTFNFHTSNFNFKISILNINIQILIWISIPISNLQWFQVQLNSNSYSNFYSKSKLKFLIPISFQLNLHFHLNSDSNYHSKSKFYSKSDYNVIHILIPTQFHFKFKYYV